METAAVHSSYIVVLNESMWWFDRLQSLCFLVGNDHDIFKTRDEVESCLDTFSYHRFVEIIGEEDTDKYHEFMKAATYLASRLPDQEEQGLEEEEEEDDNDDEHESLLLFRFDK